MKNARADLIAREAALLVIKEIRQMGLDDADGGAFASFLLHRSVPAEFARIPNKEERADRGSTNEYRVVIDGRDPLVLARRFADQALQARPANSWHVGADRCFIYEERVIERTRGAGFASANPDPRSLLPIAHRDAEHIFGDRFRSVSPPSGYRWVL